MTAASAAYLNIGLEPTPYSVRDAPASGRGSPRALGGDNDITFAQALTLVWAANEYVVSF